MTTTEAWVARLQLKPHPEGGFYRETFRAPLTVQTAHGPRAASTAILFLLPPGGVSRLHRVCHDEVWHHYQGGPVALTTLDAEGTVGAHVVGDPRHAGQHPQVVVPGGVWQAARNPSTEPALCGCTVAPGFDFADFELVKDHALAAQFPQHTALIAALS